MRVHFVIHEAFEAPGAYEHWVQERGHRAGYSRVYQGEPLPTSLEGLDLLVVLGGPQSPSTTLQECPHFDAAAECALIARTVAAGKPVVGVCLGAQLMGEALGAACERSPEREIGAFPITLTEAGRAHGLLADFPAQLLSGHWHGDMPGLTPDARVLAGSAGCPRQIVEYGPLAYGFQCHMEFTAEVVERLIAASGPELAAHAGSAWVQQPAQLRRQVWQPMNATLFTFLDRLAAASADGMRP